MRMDAKLISVDRPIEDRDEITISVLAVFFMLLALKIVLLRIIVHTFYI